MSIHPGWSIEAFPAVFARSRSFLPSVNCVLINVATNDTSADQAGSYLSGRREGLLDDF